MTEWSARDKLAKEAVEGLTYTTPWFDVGQRDIVKVFACWHCEEPVEMTKETKVITIKAEDGLLHMKPVHESCQVDFEKNMSQVLDQMAEHIELMEEL